MLCDTWEMLCSVEGVRPVLAAAEEGWFPELLVNAEVWLQAVGDLGVRMESIFERGLETAAAVVAVGADSPEFGATHVREALLALQKHDAVLGPTFDGGFYLLGLKRCPRGLLAGLPWSTNETCSKTEERLRGKKFSTGRIEALPDVDVIEDLQVLRRRFEHNKDGAPRTSGWLAQYDAEVRSARRG